MIVDGFNQEELWTTYGFFNTYSMSWEHCIAFAMTVFEYTDNVEVLVVNVGGSNSEKVEIKNKYDMWKIPETGCIIVRGNNKIYDGVPMQHKFFNQTNQILVDVPTSYINSLKKNKDELLDNEGKKHTFDKYMDSIEVNGENNYCQKLHQDDLDAILTAITKFGDFDSPETIVYKNGKLNTNVNISEICRKVVENYKRGPK